MLVMADQVESSRVSLVFERPTTDGAARRGGSTDLLSSELGEERNGLQSNYEQISHTEALIGPEHNTHHTHNTAWLRKITTRKSVPVGGLADDSFTPNQLEVHIGSMYIKTGSALTVICITLF